MIPLIIGGVTLAVISYALCEDGCDIFTSQSSRKNSSNDDEDEDEDITLNPFSTSNDSRQYTQFHARKVVVYETTFKEFKTLLSQMKNTEFKKLKYDEPRFQSTSFSQYSNSDSSKESLLMIEDLKKSLSELDTIFDTYNKKLGYIVLHADNYKKYDEKDKEIVKTTLTLAKMIDKICHVEILAKDGGISKKSKKVLSRANGLLSELNKK